MLTAFVGYTMSITVPTDISAAASLVEFWNKSINPCVFITVFLVVVVVVNYLGVRLYGEVCLNNIDVLVEKRDLYV